MSKILYILGFLFFLSVCKAQSIQYAPLGPMDKPHPHIEIVIAKTHEELALKGTFVKRKERQTIYKFFVDTNTFSDIKKNVIINKTTEKYEHGFDYEYGSYRIILSDNETETEYVLLSHKKSRTFFKKQLSLTKSNDWLYEELEELIQRFK